MNNSSVSSFDSIELGTPKPISVPMETIEVEITGELFEKYADAFVREAYRVNPLRAEQVNLKSADLDSYIKFLITKRIECVYGVCKDFRKLKALYIPAWVQYNLSMIGQVNIRDRGICLMPVETAPSTMTIEEAYRISDLIGMFIDDLQIVRDAMPRTVEGDLDVMSTALIAGYMRSLNPVKHVISTYASAFMGLKLKQEAAFKALFRIQYDDLEFIASALTTQKGLF